MIFFSFLYDVDCNERFDEFFKCSKLFICLGIFSLEMFEVDNEFLREDIPIPMIRDGKSRAVLERHRIKLRLRNRTCRLLVTDDERLGRLNI
jgi:hypothetical protein